MKISKIYKYHTIKNNHLITKITNNSKEVIDGSIFVAINGYSENGEKYIDEAIKKGALTIIVRKDFNLEKYNKLDINFIKVSNPKKELAILFKKIYGDFLTNFKIIGITGTSGKTTCCTLLYKYLRTLNLNTICFTSNGNFINDNYLVTVNTTPNISIIYNTIINSNIKKGYIIIEISSQAISELRVLGIPFDIIGITNITSDHLDYHKNVTDYFYTKSRLIYQLKEEGNLILNHDSKYFNKLESFTINPVYSFGSNINSDFLLELVESKDYKTLFLITCKDQIVPLETSLIGKFNIENITLVFGILNILNLNLDNFSNFIKNISPVDGRMNIYKIHKRTIIIDYAHTSNAVESALKTIKELYKQNIKLIIGCGGNRDHLKRPIIGKLSCKYADFVYFTEDNSRNESLSKILKEITCDLTTHNYMIIESRMNAIKKAVMDSKENDVIVLMGKGCENTLVENTNYTDLEMIKKCFQELKGE